MVSAWIQHIKKVQKEKGLSYKEAMSVAAKSYQSSPETGTKKHHKRHHKKHHKRHRRTKKHHKKKHRRRHKRHHRGGEQNAADTSGTGAAKPTAEIGGTAAEGSSCTLPARSGSGSVTQADLLACSGAAGAACGKAGGGHRGTKKHRRKKKRKTRRKSRSKRRRRRRRR